MADNILKGTIKIDAPGVQDTANRVGGSLNKMRGESLKLSSSLETLIAKLEAKKQFLLTEKDITRIAEYNREIASLKGQIDKIRTLGVGDTGIGKLGVAATEGLSSLRKLAYFLPGIGVAGLVGQFSNLFTELISGGDVLDRISAKLGLMSKKVVDVQSVFGSFKSIFEEATKKADQDIVKLEVFKEKLNDLNIPATERLKILREYNAIADKTNQIDATQINNLTLINEKIDAQNALIIKRALTTAALSKITEAANKLIENEMKLQEEFNKRGFKDLEDYEKKTNDTNATANKLKSTLQDLAQQKILNAQGLPEARKGLDGVVNPAKNAATAVQQTDNNFNALVNSVKKGRGELQGLAKNLSGLITIDGLTTEKIQDKTGANSKFNFFDEFISFDPKNVKAETEDAAKAFEIFAKYALENHKRLIGLDEILNIESKPAAIKAAAEWWEAYSKAFKEGNQGIFLKLVPSLDISPKIKLDQKEVEASLQASLKELTKSKIDTNSSITLITNPGLIKDYTEFKEAGARIGRAIGAGFDETFSKIFDDAFRHALEKGLKGDALENFKAEFQSVATVAAKGMEGIADSFAAFTDAVLQGKNGMQAFGEALKNTFRSIAVEIVKDIVLAGILSALSGGSANGGLSFIQAFGKIFGGSHATGLKRVPKDGYVATLHRDEMVVPARQAGILRQLMGPDFSLNLPQVRVPSFAPTSFSSISNAASLMRDSSKTIDVNVYGEFVQRGGDLVSVINKTNRKQTLTV